jgi:hypothetical protein
MPLSQDELESGALFLGSSSIYPTLLTTSESLLYVDHMRYVWSRVICGQSVRSMWHVEHVSPVGCTFIQITASLGYE